MGCCYHSPGVGWRPSAFSRSHCRRFCQHRRKHPCCAAKLDPFSSESEDEAGVHRPGGVRTMTQRVRSDADQTLAGQRLDAQRAHRDFEPSESLADDDEVPYDPAGHAASRKSTSSRPPKPVCPQPFCAWGFTGVFLWRCGAWVPVNAPDSLQSTYSCAESRRARVFLMPLHDRRRIYSRVCRALQS